jgi:menaquinol-cytochrome c reductase iron-sulfur subunit
MNEKKPKKPQPEVQQEEQPERRSFLVRASAMVIGGFVCLFPAAAGLAVFIDPLSRKSQAGKFIKVADINEVPPDGMPRSFPVIMDRWDTWNFYPREPVGAVYLRRTTNDVAPEAVTATCPHLGCFVDFKPSQGVYQCPCHDSKFKADGQRINPDKCPAARDLDSLEVEVREQEVWVKFQKFISGNEKKIPEA